MPVLGGYQHEDPVPEGVTDRSVSALLEGMLVIEHRHGPAVQEDGLRLEEADPAPADVVGFLERIPRVLEHTGNRTRRRLPATYPS